MKHRNLVLAFTLMIAASTAFGSELVSEVIKLQRAGIQREVMLHFVQDSPLPSNLSAGDIQRLDDEGVSATVIVAMLDRGKDLREDAQDANFASRPVKRDDPAAYQVSNPDASTYASHTEVYAPREDQANISLFYEALAPHGTWSRDASYGWVWQPGIQSRDRGWRPYANDGHWVWTDHGWYWESTYSYGWAVYHYGRWHHNHERNWVWVPDNVWGPSWVDWRQSDTHLGWAPLPPESHFDSNVGFRYRNKNVGFSFNFGLGENDYFFVSSDRFLESNLHSHFVPETRVRNIYNSTTIVNNTYVYNDNRIINQGIPREVVARATKRQVEVVKIEDSNIAPGQPIRGERRNANKIVTYRPKVTNAAPVEPPAIVARQKEKAAAAKEPAKPARRETINDRRDAAEVERDARRRMQEVKAQKSEDERTGKKAAVEVKKDAQEKAREDNRDATGAAATARKAAAEAEAKTRENATNARKAAAEAERESKARENQAGAAERREAREAAKEPKEKARESNTPATVTPAEERKNANEAAAAARKAAVEAESKVRAEAAKIRKDEAAAEKAAKEKARDEKREERKAEKAAGQN